VVARAHGTNPKLTIFDPITDLFFAVATILVLGVPSGKDGTSRDIQTFETLGWSFTGTFIELVCGSVAAFGLSLTLVALSQQTSFFRSGLLTITIPLFLVLAFSGAIYGGTAARPKEGKLSPNEGIKLSVKSMLKVLSLLLIAMLLSTLLIALLGFSDTSFLLRFILSFILLFGLIPALRYGGLQAMRHYILRLILSASGDAPWNYERFCNVAVDLIFMRRVGGGYEFMHDFLRDHFAQKSKQVTAE
jgi:hypothetical protein